MYLRSIAAAAALAVFSGGMALAGTTAGTPFTVQITVAASCTINSGPTGIINFGTHAGTAALATIADVSSSVNVTCTNTSPYKVYFTSVNTVTSGTDRIMTTGGSESVGYQIRQGTTPISNNATTGFYSGTGNGAAQAIAINFHINSWTPTAPVTPGTYSDTVTLNVDF